MAVISLISMPEGGKLDLGRLNGAQQPCVKLLCLHRDLQHGPETAQGSSPWEGAREETEPHISPQHQNAGGTSS